MNARAISYYKEFGPQTDPGDYGELYKDLPTTLEDSCRLVKNLLIHPVEVEKYRDQLPEGRDREDDQFYSVQDMLRGLQERSPDGLTGERKPSERLILSCRFHAMLLVSFMKYFGIPARVRVGFAGYCNPNTEKHYDHWICDIWNADEKRWMAVDPDVQKVDFERNEFGYSWDVWRKGRNGEIVPENYGIFEWWGMNYIRSNLCHDFFTCLNREYIYWEAPGICHKEYNTHSQEELEFLDTLATLLQEPEEHLDELIQIQEKHEFMQNISVYEEPEEP
jgi:hypothetical protein